MSKKILVVDNNPVILRIMTGFLEKAGHEVRTAADGLSALFVLERFIPEVIFTDLVMPNISGDKLCRIIREMPTLRDVYLVLLSAIAAEQEINFREFGADACIAKGLEDNLQKHVLELLKQSDQPQRSQDYDTDLTLGTGEIHTREITRELLHSKKHFEAMVHHLVDGILELTVDGRIIYTNQAAIALIGIREEKLLGSNFLDMFPEEKRRHLSQALQEAASSPQALDEDPPLMVNHSCLSITLLPVPDDNDVSIVVMMRDITRRLLDEKALNASEARFRELFDHMLAGVAVYESGNGKDFVLVDFNQEAERIDRVSRAEVIGKNILEVFPGAERFGLLNVLRRVWQSGGSEEHPCSYYEDERLTAWRENYVYKLPSGEVVAIYRDVTDQKRAEEQLAFESEINAAVAQLSQMLITADSITDISTVLLEHAMRLTGSTSGFAGYLDREGSLQTQAISAGSTPGGNTKPRSMLIKKIDGLLGWVMEKGESVLTNEAASSPQHCDLPPGHVPITRFLGAPAIIDNLLIGQLALANSPRDYNERDREVATQLASLYALAVEKQRNEQQIAHLAHHDPLTNLANRHLLPDRLEQALQFAHRQGKLVAILYLDLDNFKEINDSLGHKTGDMVLKELAKRFLELLRASDTVVRMGGDEFLFVLQGIKQPRDAGTVAQKILQLATRPLDALGGTGTVTGSIGISLYPADGDNADLLLQKADEAMYRAKQEGGRHYIFHAPPP